MTPNSVITNPDQVNMRKNSCLINHSIIFVFSENEFEKIENHSVYLNISTESNKEQGVEVFQVRLKGQRKIDERVFDPLDLKLRVACMIRPPVNSMFFSSPSSSCQTANTHSRNRPHQNQFHN